MKPSALYRAELWRAGLLAARWLPARSADSLAGAAAGLYRRCNRTRRETVKKNLLPIFQFDEVLAEEHTRALFRNFGFKLADLWRYEAGGKIQMASPEASDWERLEAARARGRGLLLLTVHIGNWEFGAPFLRERGVELQVITQAEPDDSFTEMRKAARARWGIETFVIGNSPFAFVDLIRRLESGAAVALLMDRPAPQTAITVKLFGHRFPASIGAAELARVSGCALLPVCLPRGEGGYSVEMLPEIRYERASLGTREARANLTQEIMRQFEPCIRRYAGQWYHFVPVWEKEEIV
jgi:KDO2-lipid IV(A) lauroyltransferase